MAQSPQPRVRFPGSDEPIRSITEEKLVPEAGDESDEDAEAPPNYKREEIGPRVGDPVEASAAVQEVKEQLDTEDCVPLIFPREVRLQDKGIMHHWATGVHLVPLSLAGDGKKGGQPMHWWLKHNRVRRGGNTVLPNPAKATAEED